MNVRFMEIDCEPVFTRYQNNQVAIQLVVAHAEGNQPFSPGMPVAKATVSIPFPMQENEVAIKDYSENEGILDALINAGVVHPPHKHAVCGHAMVPICKLR